MSFLQRVRPGLCADGGQGNPCRAQPTLGAALQPRAQHASLPPGGAVPPECCWEEAGAPGLPSRPSHPAPAPRGLRRASASMTGKHAPRTRGKHAPRTQDKGKVLSHPREAAGAAAGPGGH